MNRRILLLSSLVCAAGGARLGTLAAQTPVATPGGVREFTDARGITLQIPTLPQRVLALGEELLLADLLELGITPAASSGNYSDRYVGIDLALTEGLMPYSM